MISWTASKEEHDLILAIAKRVIASNPQWPDSQGTLMMDIEATHCNGCPLDLRGLLNSSAGDFVHDVSGIRRHIDRSTGHLDNSFLPRYAASQHDAKPL